MCELETPDGGTQTVSVATEGTIDSVLVSPGDVVYVGDPLLQVSDNSFATYHQRPAERPIDVEPIAVEPDAAVAP